jgi:hypothetical protein
MGIEAGLATASSRKGHSGEHFLGQCIIGADGSRLPELPTGLRMEALTAMGAAGRTPDDLRVMNELVQLPPTHAKVRNTFFCFRGQA